MIKKKKILIGIVVSVFILIAFLYTPALYKHHATGKLTNQLDKKYGKDGWVAAWIVSDRQIGEQINLYRTLYLKFLYPKFITLTPYKNLQFTHKARRANIPPHYAVLVYCREGEFAYRWSMKKHSWYISYQNSIAILPVWEKEKIYSKLANIERINGLSLPKETGRK